MEIGHIFVIEMADRVKDKSFVSADLWYLGNGLTYRQYDRAVIVYESTTLKH